MPDIYNEFVRSTHELAYNTIYASCSIIEHDPAYFMSISYDNPLLEVLSISEDIYIPYDYSCRVDSIDSRRIMID
jgi:hypothetical protein